MKKNNIITLLVGSILIFLIGYHIISQLKQGSIRTTTFGPIFLFISVYVELLLVGGIIVIIMFKFKII